MSGSNEPFQTPGGEEKYKHLKRFFTYDKKRNCLAKPGPHQFVFVLDRLKPTFNVGKIFRTAESFGVKEIHLIGIPFFDARAAKGAFRHVPAFFHKNASTCISSLVKGGYRLFALAPSASNQLGKIELPQKTAFILGHEEYGLSPEMRERPELEYIQIPHSGRSQSLNVSVAASIAAWEYVRGYEQTPVMVRSRVETGL